MNDGAVIPSPDGDRRAAVMPGAEGGQGRERGEGRVVRTARLVLTPVAEHELEELLALHADPRAFAEDLTEPVTSRAQMRWVLRRWRESWDEHGVGYLSVRALARVGEAGSAGDRAVGADTSDGAGDRAVGADTSDDDAGGHVEVADSERRRDSGPRLARSPLPAGLLGVVGLTPLTVEGRPVLSAYWRLSPAATGQGVASEAMRAVLAQPRRGGREIIAVTAAGNAPSRALAARLGFVPAPSDRPVPGGRPGDVLLLRDS